MAAGRGGTSVRVERRGRARGGLWGLRGGSVSRSALTEASPPGCESGRTFGSSARPPRASRCHRSLPRLFCSFSISPTPLPLRSCFFREMMRISASRDCYESEIYVMVRWQRYSARERTRGPLQGGVLPGGCEGHAPSLSALTAQK
ncbi:unnamed protein product [Rangifer tarandus platyrhynchus]|uniref:Uncharacterized protein n=1 Tax=Rangifer tarandus platyrhynchus TaxID=3082113 RepID=A0AC59YP50_RANTA